jgi:nicotinamidase-related amidase
MDTQIDKSKTALVIIDLQKGIAGMETKPHDPKSVIENAGLMAEAFRKNNMPVFLVHVTASADGKDRLNPAVDGENPWANRQMPPDWSDIVPELGPKSGDFIITKKNWGAFYGTDLDLQLRRRKIDTVVLCGIATNIGVESTARFAYEFGYNQIFVEDACNSFSPETHEFAIKNIFPRMGKIRATQDILSALE